jgi:uncharacterized protein DUF4239
LAPAPAATAATAAFARGPGSPDSRVIRFLLNNFSTPVLAVFVIGGFIIVAAVGLAIVRTRWPHFIAGEHNDVAGILLQVVGAMYGILLAFVIVSVYQSFSDTESNVREEATALAQIHRDVQHMPIAGEIDGAINDYVHTVVEVEWPLMAEAKLTDRGWADVDALFTVLQGYEPQTNSQSSFYDAAIGDLNDIVATRRARLFDAQEEIPEVLQWLLFVGALGLIAFTWLFGMKRFRTQLLMVLGVAILLGASLLIAMELDHPFSGDLTVSPQPFREGSLAVFWH